MRIIVYADGGCDPNPGPGGWGVVILGPDGVVDLCGGEPGTTNNRMELTAAIRALEHFPEGAQIEMRCDSQYVVKSVTEWMRGWKAKGWRTTTGAVKNVDLMQRLDELASRRDVKWTWVRGHAGDPLNERADRLATRGRVAARSKPKSAVAQPPSPVGTTTAAKTLLAAPTSSSDGDLRRRGERPHRDVGRRGQPHSRELRRGIPAAWPRDQCSPRHVRCCEPARREPEGD